jgi:hypothetical protein
MNPEEDETPHELQEYQGFLDHRKTLDAAALEISGRFTQWMLTLSGGALALSITFVEKLRPVMGDAGRCALLTSWICFGLALVASLISLYTSYCATKKAIKHHDDIYRARQSDPNTPIAQPVNTPGNFTDYLSWASIGLFTIGIIAFCVFAVCSPPSATPPPTDAQAKPISTTSAKKD